MPKKNWLSDKPLEKLSLKRLFLFNFWISCFTIFFSIFSLLPILFFRMQTESKNYYFSLIALFTIFFFTSPVSAIILVAVVLGLEIFFFLESYKNTLFLNILLSSFVFTGFLYLSFFIFKEHYFAIQLFNQIELVKSTTFKYLDKKVLSQIATQLPSIIYISFSFLLFFSLRFLSFFKSAKNKEHKKSLSSFNSKDYLTKLKKRSFDFSLPSWTIWIFILTLFLSFVNFPIIKMFKTTGLNILNVFFGFYFLQGLCLMTDLLSLFKIKKLSKKLIYFLSFVYFFRIISIIGFMDYWFDFKKKIKIYKLAKILDKK